MVRILKITDIKIRKMASDNNNKMKAVVSITINDAFAIHDIKIIEGKDRLFTAMPSRRTPNNEYKDIVHPITTEMRQYIETSILEAYGNSMSEN